MPESLPLNNLHREAGASFTGVWGLEAAAAFGGDPALEHAYVEERAGLLDQTYRGVIDLEGARALDLLERITSNHPASLDGGRGQPACLLSAKGRLMGAFHLFRLEESRYRAVFFEPTREQLLRELRKYTLLENVETTDRTAEVSVLSVQGPRAGDVLVRATELEDVPIEPLARVETRLAGAAATVVRSGETLAGGYALWLGKAELGAAWRALSDAVRAVEGGPVGWTALESLRIEAGFARWGIDYDEESFPNEIGWEKALTYDKCYVGQEVVARMRTYGQVNRRLFQLVVKGDETPARGSRVLSGDAGAGEVTSSVRSFREGRPLALARIRRRFWGKELAVETGDGRLAVEVRELPEGAL